MESAVAPVFLGYTGARPSHMASAHTTREICTLGSRAVRKCVKNKVKLDIDNHHDWARVCSYQVNVG